MEAELCARFCHAGDARGRRLPSRRAAMVAERRRSMALRRIATSGELALHLFCHHANQQGSNGHSERCGGRGVPRASGKMGPSARGSSGARGSGDACLPVGSDVTSPSSPKGILEAVLYAKDLRAIEAFYRRALGLEPYGKPDERQVFFRCGDPMLLIFNPDVTEPPPTQDGKLPVPTHGARGEGNVCFRASADEITPWRT